MERKEIEQQLKDGASKGKVIRLSYVDRKDQESIRNVEPYEIRGDRLFAYCRKKKGIRQFDLNKIQKAKQTSYNYFPKWPIKMDDELKKTASFYPSESASYKLACSIFGPYENTQVE